MFAVASRTQLGVIGDGPNTGVLAGVHLPGDTWHAYLREGGTATGCGIPLEELHTFEALTFLPVRADDVCGSCLQGVEAATTAETTADEGLSPR